MASGGGDSLVALTLQTLLASIAFYAVNIVLLAAIVSRASGQPWPPILVDFVRSTGLPFGIMASLTVVLVALWDRSPFLALTLAAPLGAFALYERPDVHRLHEAARARPAQGRVHRRRLARAAHAAGLGLRRGDDARSVTDSRADATALDAGVVVPRESARLARLVDQVLWASRLESVARRRLRRASTPPGSCSDVVQAARAHLPEGLTLDFSVAAGTPPVAGDLDKIRQVLVNLVENAVKYSPDGGRVAVGVDRSGRFVRFTVTDEGLGIPIAEQRPDLREFHRLDPNQTRGVSGTGLGLYIYGGW